MSYNNLVCIVSVSRQRTLWQEKWLLMKTSVKDIEPMTFLVMEQSLNHLGHLSFGASTIATVLTFSNNKCTYIQHLKLGMAFNEETFMLTI